MFKLDRPKSTFNFTLECSAALGMSNGAISKSQITASSILASYGPDMARLNSMSAWCAKAQSGQYIQVRCVFFKTWCLKLVLKNMIEIKSGDAKC